MVAQMECRLCREHIGEEYFDFAELLKEMLPEEDHRFIEKDLVYCKRCAKKFKRFNGKKFLEEC